ncbi:hypothetical protein C8J56DRAFT_244765 [Mycena floridula]|nr:hypothetical protein C8J56DRAFT_244765 [Mycena floridula]
MDNPRLEGINRLPVELLAYIFILSVPAGGKDMSWVKVSHVCRHWRQTALGCPSLWSRLALSSYSAQWTKVMLERSKRALLAVRSNVVRVEPKRLNAIETVLAENLDRIGVLDLSIKDTDIEELFVMLISAGKEARFLYDLSLDISIFGSPTRKAYVLDILFPSTTSFIDPNRLERLQLVSSLFTMKSPFYKNLTHLSLTGIPQSDRPTMTDFLFVLSTMKRLQELSLVDATPARNGRPPLVHIPTLQSLTLEEEDMSLCTDFLRQLLIQRPVALCIITENDSRGDYYWTTFWKTVLPLTDGNARYTKLMMSHYPGSEEFALGGDGACLPATLGIGPGGADRSAPSIASYLLSTFTLKHIVRLDIHHAGWNCRDILIEGLASSKTKFEYHDLWRKLDVFEQLEELHLWDSPPVLLMEILLGRAMGCCGVRYGSDPLLSVISDTWQFLPKLKQISLHSIDCAWTVPSTVVKIETFFFLDILRAFFWARSVSRGWVRELVLENCRNVSKSDLGHLRLFCDVLWDGKGELVGHERPEFEWLWAGDVVSYSKQVYFAVVGAHSTMVDTEEKLEKWSKEYLKFLSLDIQEETDESGSGDDY